MPESLGFFNTRTRQVEDFRPIEPGTVRMYCCGPTVYNYAHIGNLRDEMVSRHRAAFWAALGDDLHLPRALAVAWAAARDPALHEGEKLALLREFDHVFGVGLGESGGRGLTEAQSALIRDRLLAERIRIKDRADGTDWSRVE